MARKGITYDAVANAAKTIKARGQEPTIAAVRVECGDEGSYTTISTHLAKWRADEMDRVDTRTLPREVENEMMKAVMSVWNVANKAASDDLAAIKQDHADETKRLKGELDSANAEIAELEKKLANAEDEATNAKGLAARFEKEITAAASVLATTKSLYKELLESIKPQAATGKQAADTKSAHQQQKAAGLENTPGGTH